MIERLGVVVPAHDEERLLADCLAGLRVALARVDVPARVVLVLDDCHDGSPAIAAEHPWVSVVTCSARNVGRARGIGAEEVRRWAGPGAAATTWLANTDADSVVPPDWARQQLAWADAGWDVVVGTVTVEDWTEHAEATAPAWRCTYQSVNGHPHIHGANLGCRLSAYLDVGGWRPLAADEDVALLRALAHRPTLRTADIPVLTSARRDPRASGGFGDALRAIAG